jgi:hypothetical protein
MDHHIGQHQCNAGYAASACPCGLVHLLTCRRCHTAVSIRLPKRSEWCVYAEEVYRDACARGWLISVDERVPA